MSIYDDIFEASSSNSQMAGHLHELLWERLLQREDPRFHNIRLTKGDGGIDGLILKDPILGEVTVFQAKFYRNLSTLDYKSSIEASFIKAHSNELKIVEWCLLLPINLSHTELCWLLGGGLKKCAIRKCEIALT